MLFAPIDDRRIDLADGYYYILKSADKSPAIVLPEPESGLYKDGILQYRLPVSNSHYCNYLYESSGKHFVLIHQTVGFPSSMTFFREGKVVNEVKFNDLGVPESFIPLSSAGWAKYWGGFEKTDGSYFNVGISRTNLYVFGHEIPLTGPGNVRVNILADTYEINKPSNYVIMYGVVISLLIALWLTLIALKRKCD